MSYNLGLIGSSITHSKSKEIYKRILGRGNYHLFDFRYFPKEEILLDICKNLDGLSVTAPYKEEISKLAIVDDEIKDLKAVNCIKLLENKVVGTNTDYYASKSILERYKKEDSISSALLLGDGAMARVLISLFDKLEIKFTQLKRSDNSLSNFSNHNKSHDLLINTCAREFDLSSLGSFEKMLIWDLNYSQSYEQFFIENYSGKYSSGLELLEEQAKLSLLFWKLK